MERTPWRTWWDLAVVWWRAHRVRWLRSLVLVGLAAGVVAGAGVAAVDGARRTATVIDRVSAENLEPDVMVLPDRPGFDWGPVAQLPEIAALLRFGGPICALDLPLSADGSRLCGQVFLDRTVGHEIGRTKLDAGRGADLERADEVEVTRAAAQVYGVRVGDTVTVVAPTAEQIVQAFASGQFPRPDTFAGARVEVTVVGIDAPALADRLVGSDTGPDAPAIYATPAFAEVFGSTDYANAMARLQPGTNIAEFRRHVAEVSGEPVPVRNLADDRYRLDRSLLIERWALVAFAAVLLVAGAVLVGQALGRLVRTAATDVHALVVLGATRREAAGLVAAPFVVTAATAVVVTIGVALGLSTRFPIGTARSLEPSLGVHVDWLVLGLGLVVLLVAIAARVGLTARAAVMGVTAGGRVSSGRRRSGRVARRPPTGLPVPIELGARLALAPPRTGRAGDGPARAPVLVGAAIGVLGIVGAWTFGDGLDRVIRDEALAGTTWDHVADLPPGGELPDLTGVPGVAAAAEVVRAPVELGGQTVSVWSYEAKAGDVRRVLLEGRLPSGPDEATAGWGTARTLDVVVGDTVSSPDGATFRLVGIGLLPEEPGHSGYDQGLWVTPAGFARLAPTEFANRKLLVDLGGPDADTTAVAGVLSDAFGYPVDVRAPDPPAASRNLGTIRRLPLALAVFLAALALGVSAHAVTTTIRRRRHDFAVLRALGATRRQIRAVVASQATTIGLVGIVIGVPLGIILGRLGWRWVAHSVPFVDTAPVAVVATIVVVPAVLAAVNLVAGVPGRRAAAAHPAEVLRAE